MRARGQWKHGLNTLVAGTLCVAGCTGHPAASPAPGTLRHVDVPAAGNRPSPSPRLIGIHMLTPTVGWAYSADAVLRTSDGGATWRPVGPPDMPGHGPLYRATFDASRAAAVGLSAPRGSAKNAWTVYTTADAGATWTTASVPGPLGGPEAIDFSGDSGWLLLVGVAVMGAEESDVYHTLDAGAHWTLASGTTWSTKGPGAILPRGGKSGLAFVTPLRGWATISNDRWQGHAELYGTDDAGVTWRDLSLPIPARLAAFTSTTLAPTFTGGRNGMLPVLFDSIDGKSQRLCLYHTVDSGETWTAGTDVPAAVTLSWPMGDVAPIMAMASPDNAWVWDGTQLEVTRDAGATWRPVTPSGPLQRLAQLDFVSPTVGFALLSNGSSASQVLRTEDGGSTWSAAAH